MFTRCGKKWNGLGGGSTRGRPKTKTPASCWRPTKTIAVLPSVTYTPEVTTCQGPKWETLFADGGSGVAVGVLAPLVVDLGGVLRGEAVNGGYRGYEVLWFLDLLGEPLKLAEVDSWMAEHFFFFSLDCAQ
jgi:hypothetical protein